MRRKNRKGTGERMKTILSKLSRALKTLKKELKKGWTFMETIITIAIVLILTSTVGFVAAGFFGDARKVTAENQIANFSNALNLYYFQNSAYPTEDQGLDALWEKPTSSPVPENWSRPFLNGPVPQDPWGNDYIYKVPGSNGLDFEIISYGADGSPGGEGDDADISSAD
jgi:general secretion pathway protein G